MNKSKHKKTSLWFDIGIGILFTAFTIFIFIMVLINENPNKIIGYGVVVTFGFYSYINLTTALYRKEYREVSDGINAKVDNGKLIITNTKKKTTKVIENRIVKNVELYYSWNINPITSDLGFSKITMNDNSKVFLVSDTINQDKIRTLFKTKVSKEKNRFMNKLK